MAILLIEMFRDRLTRQSFERNLIQGIQALDWTDSEVPYIPQLSTVFFLEAHKWCHAS